MIVENDLLFLGRESVRLKATSGFQSRRLDPGSPWFFLGAVILSFPSLSSKSDDYCADRLQLTFFLSMKVVFSYVLVSLPRGWLIQCKFLRSDKPQITD
jgi:hypothetical protein